MKESNKDLIIGILVRHLGNEVLNSRICEIGEEIYNKLNVVNKSDVIGDVVGSYNLKVGDNITFAGGLKAEVIETKVKVKDEFGKEYYLSDIEVG